MEKVKIVFLQKKSITDRMFNESQLKQIAQFGDLVLNESDDNLTKERMGQLIKGADIVVTSWAVGALTADILEQAPNLKIVLHAAGSVKPIVTDALYDRGVRVVSCNDSLAKGVAETALGLTISSLKDMWRIVQLSKAGGWGEYHRVKEMYGIKIGVIGAGRAGTYYIKLLQNFDVEVLVYDPFQAAEGLAALGARKVELPELFAASDLISIHAPSLPETERMLNEHAFSLMKDDCIIINTARGAVIDEEAFIKELAKGRFFACLDVTEPEPPALDHPFRSLPNVILTSHIAGAVNNGLYRIGEYLLSELACFIENKPLHGEVKREHLSSIA